MMFTIRSQSDEGTFYLVNGWYTNKRFWMAQKEMKPDMLFKSAANAKSSLTKLLKVMPEYKMDKFDIVQVDGDSIKTWALPCITRNEYYRLYDEAKDYAIKTVGDYKLFAPSSHLYYAFHNTMNTRLFELITTAANSNYVTCSDYYGKPFCLICDNVNNTDGYAHSIDSLMCPLECVSERIITMRIANIDSATWDVPIDDVIAVLID